MKKVITVSLLALFVLTAQAANEQPNMDSIVAEGVHFKNAFVTTALCSPSRATILTGQYANTPGVVDNNAPLREGTIFFPSYLQEAGYKTGFIGKWVSFRGQGHYYPGIVSGEPNKLE